MLLPYETAIKLANQFKRINKQLKLHLVGSLARRESHVKDIDFVTRLQLPNGKKYYKTKIDGIRYDIWQYDNLEYGKFIRTVDKGHLIAIYKGLRKNKYKLTPTGIINLKTKKVLKFSKKRVYKLAGLTTI